MRTSNSIKNMSITIFSQVIIAFLGFLSRKIFIDNLGIDYLGVNGLLTNVLSALVLVESGIGSSIVYKLYKPLAENDKPKIIALIQLYKRAYIIIAILILLLSISLYPLLGKLMQGQQVSYITLAYFIFVSKNIVGYLNAHKISLISADQKGYILGRINFFFNVFTMICRIAILIATKDYILYLLLELIIYIIQTLYNGSIVNKRYSYIKTKEKYTIDKSEQKGIIKNVKALFLHNLGSYVVFGTDNLLISSFIGIVTVGLYSNYTLITGQLSSLLAPVLGGMGASIGNLIVTESKEKTYSIFKTTYLINFWIYSVAVIFLYNLLTPFIKWWLGGGYLLNSLTVLFILFNFYLTGLRASISSFKDKAGIFIQDKYVPLIEGGINLALSLILVKHLGLLGILLGTTISTLLTVFWVVPFLTYKYLFNRSVWPYFLKYGYFILITIGVGYITVVSTQFIGGYSFPLLVLKGILSLLIPNIMYFIIFYRSREFQYIYKIIEQTLKLNVIFKKQVKVVS